MRIAYVSETWPPEVNGVAFTAARCVRHLRAAGHEVQLVRPRQVGEAARDDADEWRTAGWPIPMYPALRFGWAGSAALRARWCGERAPDLVHLVTPGPLARNAARAAWLERIPVTADFRTNFHAYSRHYRCGWAEPLVLAWLRSLHRHAQCTFAPTDALAAELRAQGFGEVRVVGRGVDAQRFTPAQRDDELRRAWGAAEGDPVFLHVGRLAAEKNVRLAGAAFECVRARQPRARLVVVGDGPQRAQLAARHPQAVFAGEQRGDALARHYASADVFLFPSLTDTFGNVTLEAMASGLAIVAYDVAAARQHLVDGHSACLARPQAPHRFGIAALRALEMAQPDSPLRRRARQAALALDWGTVLRGFERQLVLAAAGRRGHAALA
jgi:glycosyltransferase involved in cell wall biosynthesis